MNSRVFILAIIVALLAGCSRNNGRQIKATGIVEADIISIKAQVTGKVTEILAKEGFTVQHDDVLCRIDNRKIETQIEELQFTLLEIGINREKTKKRQAFIAKNLRFLQKQVARFKRLKTSQSISGEKLETMELKLLEAETTRFELQKSIEMLSNNHNKIEKKMAYLKLILDDHKISSPVMGTILESFISVGETVFPGSPLFDVLDNASVYVEVFLQADELAGLKLNQQAAIYIDGAAEEQYSGRISYFGKKAEFSPKYIISEKERQSLLYKVKLKIEEKVGFFKIGMPVTVVFIKEDKANTLGND